MQYWVEMKAEDRSAPIIALSPYHAGQINMLMQPFMSETTLREPFSTAYRVGHNAGILGATDAHAVIRSEGGRGLDGEAPISNPDFFWVYQRKLTGIIELKPWWKVNNAQIDEVRRGINPL